LTKLDDLREFVRNKHKKKNSDNADSVRKNLDEKETFSAEVAGSDATSYPLASFGTEETDPDLVGQMYSSARNRVPRGEGASYWDQD
jgi:hypothetical protein